MKTKGDGTGQKEILFKRKPAQWRGSMVDLQRLRRRPLQSMLRHVFCLHAASHLATKKLPHHRTFVQPTLLGLCATEQLMLRDVPGLRKVAPHEAEEFGFVGFQVIRLSFLLGLQNCLVLGTLRLLKPKAHVEWPTSQCSSHSVSPRSSSGHGWLKNKRHCFASSISIGSMAPKWLSFTQQAQQEQQNLGRHGSPKVVPE